MKKGITIILLTLSTAALLPLAGMRTHSDKQPVPGPAAISEAKRWNKHVVDSAISILRSGNIVLRRGLGADSYMLSQMNRKDKTYSHCGIVMIENGYPFIYHAIGGEDNPDQRLRRDSASYFFSPRNNDGIAVVNYALTQEENSRLRTVVAAFYAARPRFDMKFDLATDDQLYCSEFVYKALNKAMSDTAYIRASHALGRAFIGVDDLFMNEHHPSVCRIKFK